MTTIKISNERLAQYGKSLFDDCEPETADPYYVEMYGSNEQDPIKYLLQTLIADQQRGLSSNLVTGQRQCGKTTQLKRLRRELEEAGFIVVPVNVRDYLNLATPITIAAFLFGLITELDSKYESMNLTEDNKFFSFLKSLQLNEVELSLPFLRAKLKSDPDTKLYIQEQLIHKNQEVKEQTDFVLQQLRESLEQQHPDKKAGIVLIIDQFENIRSNDNSVIESVKNLFTTYADLLSFDNWHLVISVPPYLPIEVPNLANRFSSITYIPNLHVYAYDNSHDDYRVKLENRAPVADEIGVQQAKEMLKKRLPDMPPDVVELLTPLILISAGNLRALAILTRDWLIEQSLSDSTNVATAVEKVFARYQGQLQAIPIEQYRVLKKLTENTLNELEPEERQKVTLLSDGGLICSFLNGQRWHAPHPFALKQ